MAMPIRFFCVLFGLIFIACPALSEPVLIRSGDTYGQGWIFHHETGCWIATAKHVVAGPIPVIIVGSGGRQAVASPANIFRSPDLDIALLKADGDLTSQCPSSMVGDRELGPTLASINGQTGKLAVQRRDGDAVGPEHKSFSVQWVEVRLIGTDDRLPIFSITTTDARSGSFAETDSGSPIIYAGTSPGAAGLPLGLISEIYTGSSGQLVRVVRMDAVRRFLEQITQTSRPSVQTIAEQTLAAFTGITTDTNCGPQNLLSGNSVCGWRVHRVSGGQSISVTLDLGHVVSEIVGVEISVVPRANPAGFLVSTPLNSAGDQAFVAESHCNIPAGKSVAECSLGLRASRFVRVSVDGDDAEITKIRVLSQGKGAGRWPQIP